jgi:hypothetical protein
MRLRVTLYIHYLFCFSVTNDLPRSVVWHKWRSSLSPWVILVLLMWKIRSCWKLWSLLFEGKIICSPSMSGIVTGYWLLFCFRVIVYCALIVAMCSYWIHIIPTHHTLHFCEFLGLHNGVVVVSVLMGCAAPSLGKWCPTFRDRVMVLECRAPIAQSCVAVSQNNQVLTLLDHAFMYMCVCLSLNRYPCMYS